MRIFVPIANSCIMCEDLLCLALGLQPDAATDGSNSTLMMIMVAWLLIAAVLFLFRPASMRHQTDAKGHQGNVCIHHDTGFVMIDIMHVLKLFCKPIWSSLKSWLIN